VWRSLFAGQTAHSCPACRKRFRLTYTSKRYVAFLNVALVLGLTILVGYAMYGELAPILGFAALYLAAAAVVLLVLPLFARYEKTSAPYR
jgi:multisubunit Na+/H+ antiporter MnhB subunit